jgi:hypothetical protein
VRWEGGGPVFRPGVYTAQTAIPFPLKFPSDSNPSHLNPHRLLFLWHISENEWIENTTNIRALTGSPLRPALHRFLFRCNPPSEHLKKTRSLVLHCSRNMRRRRLAQYGQQSVVRTVSVHTPSRPVPSAESSDSATGEQ